MTHDAFVATQARAWATYRATTSWTETANGPGSLPESTADVKSWLPWVIDHYGIETMIDAPCGDLAWMSQVDLSALESYTGYDVEPGNILIAERRASEAWIRPQDDPNRVAFTVANLLTLKELPQVDLIFCRDFLQHLPNIWIQHVLWLFRDSGSHYLITNNYLGAGNDYSTPDAGHTGAQGSPDALAGYFYRPVDLFAPPFADLRLHQVETIRETVHPNEDYSNIPQDLVLIDLEER